MPKLSAKQLSAIADDFNSIAAEIGNYIIYHQLSVKGRLGKVHFAILEQAEKFYTLSALQVGQEAETAIQELSEITTRILESYQHLNNMKQALNLATAVLDVIKTLTSGDFSTIVEKVKVLGIEAGIAQNEEEE